jgi:segregation and condensation protein A
MDDTPPGAAEVALVVHLDGFDGPLDLLLELARGQKLDLARMSMVSLAEQYLAMVESAQALRLELAADWLVMAAWLTWLKSRLLLPGGTPAQEEGELAALALSERLRELAAMRVAVAWLGQRPQLGQEVFARGAPEQLVTTDRSQVALGLPGLLRAYGTAIRRSAAAGRYRPPPVALWTVQEALGRLRELVGVLPDWSELSRFLPEKPGSALQCRAALASLLMAGLELAREGVLRLQQAAPFGPILLCRTEAEGAGDQRSRS